MHDTTLVLGSTGKTGRRLAQRLAARGIDVRAGSRGATPPFDWGSTETWGPALAGVAAVYIAYPPDLAVPGAAAQVKDFTERAVEAGVDRIVLLSGRGEPEVLPSEAAVLACGVSATVLRAAWFCQNFSEGHLLPAVLEGAIAFPAGRVEEPFVDAEDIADVAAEVLTGRGHDGRVYDLTGPHLVTFEEAARAISAACGYPVCYAPVSLETYGEMLSPHLPAEEVAFYCTLFGRLLDGHNAHVGDGVERVLRRAPRGFETFARAAAGAWTRRRA